MRPPRGLAGVASLDPVALEARDCTHDRPTAARGVAPGSPRSDRTRAGCFRWRRDDVPWQSRKPTSERTTQTRKIPSEASGGRCAGSSSRSSNWTTPIRRARNASSSARRPVNASRSDERGPGTFFLPATAARLRALLRAAFLALSTDRCDLGQLSTTLRVTSISTLRVTSGPKTFDTSGHYSSS